MANDVQRLKIIVVVSSVGGEGFVANSSAGCLFYLRGMRSLILVSLISRAIFDISSFELELNIFWYASSNANSIYPTDIFRCTLPPRNPAVVWVNYRDNAVELSGCT